MADADPASPKKKSSFPFKHLTALRKPASSTAANGLDRDRDGDNDDGLSFFQQSRPLGLPAPVPEAKRRLKKERRIHISPDRASEERKRRKISLEHHGDADSAADASPNSADDCPNKASPSSSLRRSQKGKGRAISPALRVSPNPDVGAEADEKSKRAMRNTTRPGRRLALDAHGSSPQASLRSSPAKIEIRPAKPAPMAISDESDSVDSPLFNDNSRKASPRTRDPLARPETHPVMQAKDEDPEDDLAEYIAKVRARAANASKAPVAILLTSPLPGTKPVKANHGLRWSDDQVFMTWKKNKIYKNTTAASLGVQVDSDGRIISNARDGYMGDGLHIEVWTDELYAHYLAQKEADRALQFGLSTVDHETESEEEVAAPVEEQQRVVILKARDMEPLRIKIVNETTVADLMMNFRKQRDAGEGSQITIYNEGEKLDEDSLVNDIDDLEENEETMLEVHIK